MLCEVSARDASGYRTEKLGKDGWDVAHQEPMKNKALLRFIREHLYPIPGLLEEMGFSYDPQVGAFKARVTRQFPEKFAEWAKQLPEELTVNMDDKLKTLLADPVAAAVRFEVVNQEIDWFDLRIVIDVEGVQLSKEQIRALVAARGGYVRMDDGGWMRLEIKLDNDQRDAVTRLGLDPFDLSGETHRMHAMQLADPKAAEVFDPKAWKRIKDRTAEIKIDVKPDVPSQLQATLRPYQVDGFHFLAYLATNGFGGILADDMGLGKTIQSLRTCSGCVRSSRAKTNPRRKSPFLRYSSSAPSPCWMSGPGKRRNSLPACASSSSAARIRPIWTTSGRITIWSWSTTPSSASAEKP